MAAYETAGRKESDRMSLVQRAMWMDPDGPAAGRPLGRPDLPTERWSPKNAEAPPLPDGYVRRSPVQSYRTPEGYRRRCIRTAALIALLLALIALLVLTLIHNRFFGLLTQ